MSEEVNLETELVKKISNEFYYVCQDYFAKFDLPVCVAITAVHVYLVQMCLTNAIEPNSFKSAMDRGAVKYADLYNRHYGNKPETK